MAQLKVKQIQDFVSAVGTIHDATVGTAAGTAIAGALSDAKVYADSQDVVLKGQMETYADTAEADALSNAKVYADSQDAIVLQDAKDYSDIQKGRIDALLLNSAEALDTFVEISNFITSLETSDVAGLSTALSTAVSNDAVHSTDIAANSTAIAANATAIANLDFGMDLSLTTDALTNAIDNTNGTGVTLSGATEELAGLMTANDFRKLSGIEDGADVTDSVNVKAAGALMGSEVTNLDAVKSFNPNDYDAAGSADAAETAANGYTDGFINALGTAAYNATGDFDLAGSAAAAETAANGYTDTEIAALDLALQGQIDALKGVNSDEVVATFVNKTSFSVAEAFDINGGHVAVFVNGLQVHELFGEGGEAEGWRSDDGLVFTVQNLGYDLESDDHIIVSGTLA
jgi:hypothetical protein